MGKKRLAKGKFAKKGKTPERAAKGKKEDEELESVESETEKNDEVEDVHSDEDDAELPAKKGIGKRPAPASKKAATPKKSSKGTGSSQTNGNKDDAEDEGKGDNSDEDDEPPAKKGKEKKPAPASEKAAAPRKGGKGRGKVAATKKTVKATKPQSESEEGESDTEYEVETILDMETHRDGSREFLIKWVGYAKSKATWEPEKNLDCPDKVAAFTKKLDALKEVSVKELRTDRKQTSPYQDSVRNKGVRASRRFTAKPRTTYREQDD